jgi:DNA polymerase III subunit beta
MSDKKFEIELLTKDLIRALNFASSIIEKRNIKPVLGNVKLEASYNSLILTGTSADLSIKMSLSCNVKSSGSTTVNVITFSDIIRKLSDETVSIIYDTEKNQLNIKGHNFSSDLSTIPSDEFPNLDSVQKSLGTFKIPAKQFTRLLTNTEFSMSTEETRYNLNGVYLSSDAKDVLNATAIDGHRLSAACEKLAGVEELALILPKKTVYELIKILKDNTYADSELNVEYEKNKIFFSIDKIQLVSKLIDATFPDYKALIPKEFKNKLTIQSKLLSDTVDRVSTITHDKFRAIKVEIKKNKIEISGFGETKGSAFEIIENSEEEYFNYEGEDMSFGFNPKYLLDILKNLENDEVDLLLSASLDPIVVRPISHEDDRYVIMPMKV